MTAIAIWSWRRQAQGRRSWQRSTIGSCERSPRVGRVCCSWRIARRSCVSPSRHIGPCCVTARSVNCSRADEPPRAPTCSRISSRCTRSACRVSTRRRSTSWSSMSFTTRRRPLTTGFSSTCDRANSSGSRRRPNEWTARTSRSGSTIGSRLSFGFGRRSTKAFSCRSSTSAWLTARISAPCPGVAAGEDPPDERSRRLDDLQAGRLRCIFSVEVLGEGVDAPEVDVLFLLRPTASATVFAQQLGRGLRRSQQKSHLTVIDLIGQHRNEFRFEERFSAIVDRRRGPVLNQVEKDFPFLPAGCTIDLDRKSREIVIENLKPRCGTRAGRRCATTCEPSPTESPA